MKRLSRLRPSPAMIVACIALFVALGGVGVAAVTITGKNVKNSSLTGKDVKNSSLTGSDIKNSSLTGKDVKNNSLTGSDILESKLGKVPSASTADTAGTAGSAGTAGRAGSAASVDSVKGFRFAGNVGTPTQTILQQAGLTLKADCLSTGHEPDITAQTSVNHSLITVWTYQDGDNLIDSDFNVGESQSVDQDHDQGTGSEIMEVYYSNPAGTDLHATMQFVRATDTGSPVFNGTADCLVSGVSTAG